MAMVEAKSQIVTRVPIWRRGWEAWTNWRKDGDPWGECCPHCGHSNGTAFASCHPPCCLPLSPMPYFY